MTRHPMQRHDPGPGAEPVRLWVRLRLVAGRPVPGWVAEVAESEGGPGQRFDSLDMLFAHLDDIARDHRRTGIR